MEFYFPETGKRTKHKHNSVKRVKTTKTHAISSRNKIYWAVFCKVFEAVKTFMRLVVVNICKRTYMQFLYNEMFFDEIN